MTINRSLSKLFSESSNSTITATNVSVTTAFSAGNTTISGYANISGNLTVSGNLIVTGSTTYINTNIFQISDEIVYFNADMSGSPTSNVGIEVNRGTSTNTSLIWNEATDKWSFTNDGTTYFQIASNTDVSTAYSNAIAYSGNAALAYANAITYSGNAALAYANAIAYSGNAALAYANAIAYSGNAALAYANAIAYSANATNISSGTLNTARLPATANVSTAINVGANVNLNTSAIAVGNATINTTITSSSISTNGTLTITGLFTGSGGATITGTANASTGVNVGANVNLSTTQLNVGNSTVNSVISQTTASFNANSTATALYVAANGNIGFSNTTPAVKAVFNSTDAILLPKGTTAQQPTGVAGYLRFNTTTTQFEGYNGTAWSSVGGAGITNDTTTSSFEYPIFASATTGTALTIYTSDSKYLYKPSTGELQASEIAASNGLLLNKDTISASYTVGTGYNAVSVGPITVASGQTVTVSSGQRWVIL